MRDYQFVAQVQKDVDTGLYIGVIPNLPGAHTQAKTLDELNFNLREVITLCLEEMTEDELISIPEWVGSQNILVHV